VNKIVSGLSEGGWMLFDTFWALIFGFVLSGAIQAFVTRSRMQELLGDHRPVTIARASFFGVISSSCSYAASALAHSIYRKGADFTASMVFMFASTNLVIELGIVLWLLIGWQFAVAEFVGGAVMIILLAILTPRIIDTSRISQQLSQADHEEVAGRSNPNLRAQLSASAGYTMGDFLMLRWELIAGFIVAGLATTLVPLHWWKTLFISGHGFWSALENAFIGPVLAFISFVCSVGNVPLAAALWGAGITFGGVIAFIFADLLSLPLVVIYRKYYGNAIALRMTLLFWLIMAISGLVTEGIFTLLKQVPVRHNPLMASNHFGLNATTILNGVALLLAGVIFYLYKNPPKDSESDFAQDPICGMQVRKSDAPATYLDGEKMYYFCMEGCREGYIKRVSAGS
jgi:uncharacterized membrane protein YraQ (UPF0718 family)/YHS domain-containing protein